MIFLEDLTEWCDVMMMLLPKQLHLLQNLQFYTMKSFFKPYHFISLSFFAICTFVKKGYYIIIIINITTNNNNNGELVV